MLRRLLCWFGFHTWRCLRSAPVYVDPAWPVHGIRGRKSWWRCLACGVDRVEEA